MASTIPELAYELPPFIRVYSDGRVERLMGTEIIPPSIDPQTGVQSKDIMVAPETGVSARLYMPKTTNPCKNQKLPLVLYFHGGGFYVQTPFSPTYQSFLNTLVAEANIILLSIDYRRAPEHPLPVAYDDSWAAVKWVASHFNGIGHEVWLNDHIDFESVFIAGDSAGANIAHNMAMRVGSDGFDGVTFQGLILMHPYFWGKDPIGDEPMDLNTRTHIEKYWTLACPASTGSDDPLINPGLDPKLSSLGCSRVLVFVAEVDFLRHRGWYYNETLIKSGWGGIAEILESEGEEHVFHLYKPNCEKAMEMIKRMASFINQVKYHSL